MRTNSNLARLRSELDRIDDQLLDLVEHRLILCTAIGQCKRDEHHLMLRPNRQQALIGRLQKRATCASLDAVRHIWRELIAHSLERQANMRFLLIASEQPDRLLRLLRERFGSASSVEWVGCAEEALEKTRGEEAIAVLPYGLNLPIPDGVSVFDLLHDEEGRAVAWMIGRVSAEDVELDGTEREKRRTHWEPSTWRLRPALQLPTYPDVATLNQVEMRLATRAPLVELQDIDSLKRRLADAAQGRALLMQGGDCVETFREYSPDKVRLTAALLVELGQIIGETSGRPIVHIGRIAGQFAKPRSMTSEIVGALKLPVYRGDGVNGPEPSPDARAADPERLLRAYDQAAATMRLLWDLVPADSEPIYVSHEALLLNAEQAMTRYDELTGRWWAGSGHMLWIGDRTRQLDGAHVEYARGIANPLGLKCGPSLDVDEILRLIDRLDPDNEPGRLILIARLGRDKIADLLPSLMRATRREGRNVLWCVDPMHGNTRLIDGQKTRLLADIVSETTAFHDVAAAEGVWPGGVHLELTGTNVAECTGGKRRMRLPGLKHRYLSGCDPRLNPSQARELARIVASCHAPVAIELRKCG